MKPGRRLTHADFAELEARVLATEAERKRSYFKAQTGWRRTVCPLAQRHGQDEYRCGTCGVVWGIDEPRPPCQGK